MIYFSNIMFKYYYSGFTIVELMVVTAIIGILSAMAISAHTNMSLTSRRNVCVANLRQIDTAIEQWSIYNSVYEEMDLTPYEDQIYGYIHGDRPVCPSGGVYVFTNLGQHPQIICNVGGHEMP